MEKTNEKELEYFRLVGYIHPDGYSRYRRLTEFDVKIRIAQENFFNEVANNLLNQSTHVQNVYFLTLFEKLDRLKRDQYADYQSMLCFLQDKKLKWKQLDGFFRTMHDFYSLSLKKDGVIEYFNKEPDIPIDYDSEEMAFLKKGVGYLTAEDAEKTSLYMKKFGKYTHDHWDVHSRDILAEDDFLTLLRLIWGVVPEIPMQFPRSACGEVEDKLSKLKFYIFNSLQGESLRSTREHLILRKKMLAQENRTASFDHFEHFTNALEYNYPIEYSVASYVHQWRENLKYLKKEILDNLIVLDDVAKKAYLERLKFGCQELMENVHIIRSDVDAWLIKYDADESEIFSLHPFIPSELNRILTSEVPSFHATFEEGFNTDTESIQHGFYNFYYGQVLFEALEFIQVKSEELNPDKAEPKIKKVKTLLTVGQLSLLYKLMMDENIFDYRSKTEIYRFISDVFSTGKQEIISSDSVKNKMDSPNDKDIDTIKEKLLHMLQILQKIKGK